MQRRKLLTVVGASLGGCLSRNRTTTGTVTPTDDSTGAFPLSVSLDNIHRPSDFEAASFDVTVTEPTITRSHTATISIKFANTGDETFEVVAGDRFPFSPTVSENRGWGLLYSDDSAKRGDEDCWKPEQEYDAFARHLVEDTYELRPGDHREAQRWLWSYPAANACMPLGGTTFKTEGTILKEDTEIEWGFDLRINDS